MITYIVRRLFQLVIVLIGVTIITFLIMFAIPGDPARQLAGKNAMPEVIRSDYIRTARAKGLSERKVVTRHAFKNAIIPVMTIAGIDLGALMGGAILTETVFARPGIGLMIYQAIGARDLPVVAGGVLFATLIYVFANLFVDLGYAWVDPRIRLEG